MQRRFALSIPRRKLILASLFFGVVAVGFGVAAATNDRGLIINGAIRLGVGGATVFYGVLAGVSAAFPALALVAVVRSLRVHLEIVIDDETVTVPGPVLRPASRTVRLDDIRAVTVHRISGQEFAYVHHTRGKLSFARDVLGGRAFEEVCTILAAHANGAAPLPVAKVRHASAPDAAER